MDTAEFPGRQTHEALSPVPAAGPPGGPTAALARDSALLGGPDLRALPSPVVHMPALTHQLPASRLLWG